MADLLLGNIKPAGDDNIVVDSKYVKGSYVVVKDIAERNALKGTNGKNIVEGSLCFCQADDKFYIYTESNTWVEKIFGITSNASTSAAGLMSSTDKTKLNGIATGAEANVQSNWNETNTSSDAYIQNKPAIIKTLDSASDTDVLAASAGKALKDAVDNLTDSLGELGYGDMLKAEYAVNGQRGKVDTAVNAENLGGVTAANYVKSNSPNMQIIISQEEPTGGNTGDIWFKY